MRDSIKNIAAIILFSIALLPAAPAGAYVLKPGHILQLMADALGKTRYLKIDQRVVVCDNYEGAAERVLPETARYSIPTGFRSDMVSGSAQRIHVATGQAALTVIDGHITSEAGSLFDRYKDLLLLRSRNRLEQRIGAMGIDTGVSSLGRFHETLVFIIGAQYPDDSVSQIWVDKETFRPLRLILKTAGPLVREFEIRYLQWQETGGSWYPWRVEFFENQMMARRITVDRVSPEKVIARELFDVAALKKKYSAVPDTQDQDTMSKDPGTDEVQDTIDSFKKRFQ